MGVINITPNSFSDGGQLFGENAIQKIAERIKLFHSVGVCILDIGAESTAPMNQSISSDEEQNRFQLFFKALDQVLDLMPTLVFSIDTYRLKTFRLTVGEIRKRNSEAVIWWNDISGKGLDNDVVSLLKSDKSISYVFCHNLAPTREQSCEHINFVNDFKKSLEWSDHLNKYFEEALNYFSQTRVLSQIIFDPCFGFSKKAHDNFLIWEILPTLLSKFSPIWLIGISRKSFLKKEVLKKFPEIEQRALIDECQKMADQMYFELFSLVDCNRFVIREHWPIQDQ